MTIARELKVGGVLLMLVLQTDLGGSDLPSPSHATNNILDRAQEEEAIKTRAAEKLAINYRPSLQMKENVDFLLTPALLIQEAISPNVVLTYPSE